jgi:spore coat polysaccharide biosynthesis predicted glycosyltransferase SpsG
MRLLVRIDADHRTGLGHVVRTAALVGRLASRHDIMVLGAGAVIAEYFPGAEWFDTGGNLDCLESMIESQRPDAILVDSPHMPVVSWRRAADLGVPMIAIDDMGGDIVADVVVNGTVLEEYHSYPLLASDAVVCAGPDYCLIRPQFAQNPWEDPPGRDLLMVVGSGQRAHDWAFCLASSTELRACCDRATMVVGGIFPDREALAERAERRNITVLHSLDAEELAGLLARSRTALVTGGMVVYECLAIGVPTVVFPQIDNLVPEARWLADRGSICDLGFHGGFRLDGVIGEVEHVLSHRDLCSDLSRAARALIDGHGVERAAGVIDRFLQGLRA